VEEISFVEALESCGKSSKHLLLGNGYSICYKDDYKYNSIYDKAFSANERIQNIFGIIGTTDFEEVMCFLDKTIDIIQLYDEKNAVNDHLKIELDGIRNTLIETIIDISEGSMHEVQSNAEESNNILNHFDPNKSHIYTLNYDLLLYSYLLDYNKLHTQYYTDGFWNIINDGLQYDNGKNNNSNIHYLHGAIHLFHNQLNENYKVKGPTADIKDKIKTKVKNKDYPIFVAEGDSEKKMKIINSNKYLNKQFESFKKKMNDKDSYLFIYGVSFSDSDNHIFECINNGSVENIFISYNEELDKLKKRVESKLKDKNIRYFKSLVRKDLHGLTSHEYMDKVHPLSRQ